MKMSLREKTIFFFDDKKNVLFNFDLDKKPYSIFNNNGIHFSSHNA